LKFYFKSGTKHSVHSPFVYDLITSAFQAPVGEDFRAAIEKIRYDLFTSGREIEVTDFSSGRGRRKFALEFGVVGDFAKKSSIRKRDGELLYLLVQRFKPSTIVELGTGFGISSIYLARAHPHATVHTLEGCTIKSEIAADQYRKAGVGNTVQYTGRFDKLMPLLKNDVRRADFIFIDGDHTHRATTGNFKELLAISHPNTVFVFHDIHWSGGMEKAWEEICGHPEVTVSIDLFTLGLVFLDRGLSRQHFKLRI
jgi:predicted O-methyltransferase YrrM